MNIRFLIALLALGLLVEEAVRRTKVITDFDPSVEFSAFHTYAFRGSRTEGVKLERRIIRP
jgi:hypothetical protein